MTTRHFGFSSTLVLTLLAFAACRTSSTSQGLSKLVDKEYILQSAEGAPVLQGVPVHLHFDERGFGVHASCNHLFGSYAFEGDRIVVNEIGSTEMGCDSARHAQDEWLIKFFGAKPSVALEGPTLALSNPESRLVFLDRVVADPNRPLTATNWEVSEYVDADSAMGLMSYTAPRVVSAVDGTWSLKSPCTEGHGQYLVEGKSLRLSAVTFTKGACTTENDNTAADFVATVLKNGTLDYEIHANRLQLKGPTHGLGLHEAKP